MTEVSSTPLARPNRALERTASIGVAQVGLGQLTSCAALLEAAAQLQRQVFNKHLRGLKMFKKIVVSLMPVVSFSVCAQTSCYTRIRQYQLQEQF
ncbi:MAG: hypothetical protein M3Y27_09845, partial [Acidobacteriota bacterium]|nr:hypothetical protein [Acidobacteriota bacterium]